MIHNSFKEFIKKFFNTSGRINRKQYSLFTVFIIIASTLHSLRDIYYNDLLPVYILTAIDLIFIFLFLKYVFFTIKRLHDLNVSGWWCIWLFLIPLSNITLCFFKGAPDPNKYGDPPT
jgi:uncharacterized membrane protein YhaH (DUF805 family)